MTAPTPSAPSLAAPSKPVRANNVLAALFWMAVALASFTSVAISGRAASEGVDTIHLIFFRSIIMLVLVSVIMRFTQTGIRQIKTKRLHLHIVRNSIHFVAQYSWLSALVLIPLAQLFAIEFTAPLWVAILAPIILAERLTITRIIAAMIGFVGIVVIVQPGTVPLSPGTLFALTAALGFAGAMISTKTLVRTESVFNILFHMSWMQLAVSGLLIYPTMTIPSVEISYWIVAVALSGMMAHYALTSAFSYADAIIVAPMDFLRLPLIMFVGVLLYEEPIQQTILVGAAIVVVANLINIFGERRRSA